MQINHLLLWKLRHNQSQAMKLPPIYLAMLVYGGSDTGWETGLEDCLHLISLQNYELIKAEHMCHLQALGDAHQIPF